ncbi:MAG TPA: glucosaminidase domain-containing protein [Bacteroidales bacterium]|nr:glucosaminidase domain-containing protein [Bacteroidales bacterium]
MQKSLYLLTLLVFMDSGLLAAQPEKYAEIRRGYIERFRDLAIGKMKEFGIPVSITLAQGILESRSGTSTLAVKANNHFGIKCHREWQGDTFTYTDDKPDECFRKYPTVEDSFHDHSLFLTTRPRYASLFELCPSDYKGWARGLSKAGYATNPRYADLLIKIIEENNLYEYDKLVLAKLQPGIETPVAERIDAYIKLDSLRFAIFSNEPYQRRIYENNRRLFVFANEEDSFLTIAADFGLKSAQLIRFNDLEPGTMLYEGQIVYLQNKRARSEIPAHIVRPGEDMHFISQLYGVRLRELYRINRIKPGTEITPGTEIRLR